jgi:hypothetical protein
MEGASEYSGVVRKRMLLVRTASNGELDIADTMC